jgi:GPH family glycoside/pentoside/hexuronide:cation symporter
MTPLTLREKVGYGLGDTASNIVFQVVINFMVYFYTDVFGITAAAAGTLMLAVRLFDAVTDPLMGGIADRTRTRWGAYRPWLLWMALPYGLLAVITFTTPDLSAGGKLLYAYITYALLMTVYTAINIPYSALGGVITTDPQERASVQSWRFVLAMLGGALVTAATLPMVEFFGKGDDQKGFQLAMAVLSLVAIGSFLLCFSLTRERDNPAAKATKQSIFGDFYTMLGNDQWRIIAIFTFINLAAVALRGSATPYYVNYYLGEESKISLFLTLGMFANVAGALTANWMSDRFCKIRMMRLACWGMVLFNVSLAFVPRDGFRLALALSLGANFFHMIIVPYMFSTVADTVDYGLDRWGKGAMAMAYSGHLLSLKIGIAVGGALAGWMLALTGYVANEPNQTDLALRGIVYSISWAVAGSAVLMWVCLRFYRLDRDWSNARSNTLSNNGPSPSPEATSS